MAALVYELKRAIVRLECSGCGAEANASCDCAKPYVPARAKAAAAIVAKPEKSNRAIADEIGVSHETVRRARESTATGVAVDERVGLDGKTRRMPQRAEPDDDNIESDIEPGNYRGAFLIRADQAKQFATYSGPITSEVVTMARQVAAVWEDLANKMEEKL